MLYVHCVGGYIGIDPSATEMMCINIVYPVMLKLQNGTSKLVSVVAVVQVDVRIVVASEPCTRGLYYNCCG